MLEVPCNTGTLVAGIWATSDAISVDRMVKWVLVAALLLLGELRAAPPSRRNCWLSTEAFSISETVLTKWKLEFQLPIPEIGIHTSWSSVSAGSLAKQHLKDHKSWVLVYAAIAILFSFLIISREGSVERCLGLEQGCGFEIPGCWVSSQGQAWMLSCLRASVVGP